MVWVYRHKQELRPFIRSQLGAHLLRTHHSRAAVDGDASATNNPNRFTVQGNDAGSSRAHVSHLLEVLHCVLGGLTAPTACAPLLHNPAVSELLVDVLMPLHAPNEMIEWRDQIPVLQCYHEQLVRCVVKLVERDSSCADTQKSNSATSAPNSVLVQSIKLLLKLWPDAYQSNTPKQVLLLHELEMLLEFATLTEFHSVLQILLVYSHLI